MVVVTNYRKLGGLKEYTFRPNKTERDSDLKNTLMVVRGQLGTLGWSCTHGYIQNGYNQQGPVVWHMEFCSKLCASLDGQGAWGRMDKCMCMADSVFCPPETTTTLFIGCTLIQKVQNRSTHLFS